MNVNNDILQSLLISLRFFAFRNDSNIEVGKSRLLDIMIISSQMCLSFSAYSESKTSEFVSTCVNVNMELISN